MQELLLPSQIDLGELKADLPPTSVKLQIVQGILQNACDALDLPCPSLNHLRQQEWILKDKSGISDPKLTQIRAQLWFKGHHCIQQLLRKQEEIPPTIPMPSDLLTINDSTDSTVFHQRWDAIYAEYSLKPFSLIPTP